MVISMLENGMDSLNKGFTSYLSYVDAIKKKTEPDLTDYLVLKQAILSTHHGVEIQNQTGYH